jgi:CheY-like chemotaxis protein
MPNPTILLVDNDEDFLSLVKEFLESEGYRQVRCATDPVTAKEILEKEDIAIAFIDYRLLREKDDRDNSGLRVALETMETSATPKIIMTKHKENYQYSRESLLPRKGGKAAAVNFITQQEGMERMLEVIEETLGKARIFLSYVRADCDAVLVLHQRLENAGHIPWIDVKDIPGGMDWEIAIDDAIKRTNFVIICLSEKSVTHRGFFQTEIGKALKIWDAMLEDDIYLIPVRLEDCQITHSRLKGLNWVDLFAEDGFQKLLNAIKIGLSKRL